MNMDMILKEWINRYDFKGMNMYEIIVNAYGYDFKGMNMYEIIVNAYGYDYKGINMD